MSEKHWEVVDEVAGSLQAELLRGMLEAQGLEVVLSQEGIGQDIYPVAFGGLAKVQILVPFSQLGAARQLLDDYYTGKFEQFPAETDADSPAETDAD